jgi:hypothetical protein
MTKMSILAIHESPICTVLSSLLIRHNNKQVQRRCGPLERDQNRSATGDLGVCTRIIRANKDQGGDESNWEGRDAGIQRGTR